MNLVKELYLHLAGNPRTVYVLLAVVALVLAAAGGSKWE